MSNLLLDYLKEFLEKTDFILHFVDLAKVKQKYTSKMLGFSVGLSKFIYLQAIKCFFKYL